MRVEIDKETPLKTGEVIELEFNWLTANTWLRATQLAIVESRLKQKYDTFKIVNYTWTDAGVIVRCQVIEPPAAKKQEAGLSGAVIAVAIAGSMLFWYLSSPGIYKIVESPAVKTASYAFLILAVAYLFFAWRKK